MSLKDIKTRAHKESGFTIVELLIVIVVIAILAAITIVAYNGVTARANTTSAKATAGTVIKKAEAYNAEEGAYPLLTTDLTSAASSESYNLPTSQVTFVTATPGSAPSDSRTVRFLKCTADTASTSNDTQAEIVASNLDGIRVAYWDYTANDFDNYVDTGSTTVCPLTL